MRKHLSVIRTRVYDNNLLEAGRIVRYCLNIVADVVFYNPAAYLHAIIDEYQGRLIAGSSEE